MANQSGYEPVIGLEVHAQLNTNSKIFCGCPTEFGAEPNSNTCPVCLGSPGALPVLNREAVDQALKAIIALGGSVASISAFARKNYFYPDLPKGYQITQYNQPLGVGGAVAFSIDDGKSTSCPLDHIHLEEDAGKLLHPEGSGDRSRIDLNRCGTPLIEIVSRPELHSPETAVACLKQLRQTLQYLDVCTGDMEKGQFRCDANVSVRPVGSDELGTRTELKNMNSFRSIQRALEFEIDRQATLLDEGKPVQQATLLWDDHERVARPMRTKEDAPDYRYFPEPDLPAVSVDADWVASVRDNLPELPEQKRHRFVVDHEISLYNAGVLCQTKARADYFEAVLSAGVSPNVAANWITTELLGRLTKPGTDVADLNLPPNELAGLLRLLESGTVTGKSAKTVLDDMLTTGREASAIVDQRQLAQISDEAQLDEIVQTVVAQHPQQASAYTAGKETLLGFFVGQVMQATDGRANARIVNRLLKKALED